MTVTEESRAPGFDRQPPQDIAAEQSALGGMLLSEQAISVVMEIVQEADFYRPAHQIIYATMMELYGNGQPVDPVTVAAELTRSGQLMRVGGAPYLHTLISAVPTAANAGFYAEIVAEKATLRRLVEAGTRIVQLGYGADTGLAGDVSGIADAVNRAYAEVEAVPHRIGADTPVPLLDLVEPAVSDIEAMASGQAPPVRVPTGILELDRLLGGGLAPGTVTIIAARPAHGKSILAGQILRNAAVKHQLLSLLFSLEMSKMEIVLRLLSSQARIDHTALLAGRLEDDQWVNLARAAGELADAPMLISDTAGLTPMQAMTIGRRIKPKVLALDYLQLQTSGKRAESRQVEVSDFSRAWKVIAMELHIPVIVLSQLNRGPEQRQDKKPALSDLRESGSLEQDADNVILIHQPSLYNPDDRPGEADLILAKHRGGQTGTATTLFQGHLCRFVDMTQWAA